MTRLLVPPRPQHDDSMLYLSAPWRLDAQHGVLGVDLSVAVERGSSEGGTIQLETLIELKSQNGKTVKAAGLKSGRSRRADHPEVWTSAVASHAVRCVGVWCV